MRARIFRILLEGQLPGRNCLGILVRVRELLRCVEVLVEIDRGRLDVVQVADGEIDELGNIHGAIGRRGVFHHHRRTGVPLLVDVGQVEVGVKRRTLRRKRQPVPVGRPTVPRVHHRQVRFERTRHAALEGNNVELAVGTHEEAVLAFDKDDPLAVGRDLGKVVAHPIFRSADHSLRSAALAVVEGNPVEIVLNLRFVGIVGVGGLLVSGRIGIARGGAGVDEPLSIRTPESTGLHEVGIVGARQRLQLATLLAIPAQHAAGGIEDLAEAVVGVETVVETVQHPHAVPMRHIDGVDHVLAIRRDLAHEAEPLLRPLFAERAPVNHVVIADGADLPDGNERKKPLVVRRSVHVDSQGLAVAGERVTVGAGGQALHHRLALRLGDGAQAPLDLGKHRIRQGLDDSALLGFRRRRDQGNIAVKQRCAHRVL